MPTWPASLPQEPQLNGFNEEFGSSVIRSPVDGPPKARRRYTAEVDMISIGLTLTDAQLATFRSFYRDDLAAGALSFDWTFEGSAGSYQIVDKVRRRDMGAGLNEVAFNMIRVPS